MPQKVLGVRVIPAVIKITIVNITATIVILILIANIVITGP